MALNFFYLKSYTREKTTPSPDNSESSDRRVDAQPWIVFRRPENGRLKFQKIVITCPRQPLK